MASRPATCDDERKAGQHHKPAHEEQVAAFATGDCDDLGGGNHDAGSRYRIEDLTGDTFRRRLALIRVSGHGGIR